MFRTGLGDGGGIGLVGCSAEISGNVIARNRLSDAVGYPAEPLAMAPWAERLMRRFEGRRRSWRSAEREPPNLRAARPMTRLRGPDGSIYTLFVEPKRHPYRE